MAGYVQAGNGKFHLDSDEAKRLEGRQSNVNVIKTLQGGLPEGQNRYAHFCYVKLVGVIVNFKNSSDDTPRVRSDNYITEKESAPKNKISNLTSTKSSTSASKSITEAHVSIFDKGGLSMANAQLFEDCDELIASRTEYLVSEDDFTPRLADIIKRHHGDYSFKRLRATCNRFETPSAMIQHDARTKLTYKHFTTQGLPANDAKACAFAIAFYTGSQSETISQGTALIVRTHHGEAAINGNNETVGEEAAIIMFYLVRGLSLIRFYWGTVTRRVQLTKDELADYKPGALITWIQFSSSTKGTSAPEVFQARNTQFSIQSLTGRAIKEYSNFPEEDEILFLPHSSFLVLNVDYINSINYISMEQVELGLCKYSVLWVDDQIFDENWENKKHMEKASTAGPHINVHFIPKSSTETALAFLRSPFGKRLKNKETFRIVTDMNRFNETESHNAGARLLLNVRKLGFNCDCLIFTSDLANANENLNLVFDEKTDRKAIKVTRTVADLEQFVNFLEFRPPQENACVLS